jgi:predicted ABC-type sugar transport system permease subunit
MAKRIEQTRFKLVIIGLSLGLLEGLLRAFLKDFPVVEAFGFQGAVIGGYFTAKTVNNVKRINSAEGEK